MSKFNGMVQISKDDYYKLKLAHLELEMLENAGVDSWDGIDCVDYEQLDTYKQELFKELSNAQSLLFK